MQTLSYHSDRLNVSEMLRLYSLFSDPDALSDKPFRPCMKPLVDELCIGCMKDVRYEDASIQTDLIDCHVHQHGNAVVVCFSGGKDSVATAIKCRDIGYDVKLFHVHGINHSYPDEADRAREIADYLGMPLHVENVKQYGKSPYLENPLKNQMMATMALDWSERNGFGHRIAAGNFPDEHIDEKTDFTINWCDTIEMWNAFGDYILNDYEDFQLVLPFRNHVETLGFVAKDFRLLEMIQGCLAPSRYRDYWRKKNIAKYGEGIILPHRCGSCWKCCLEYVHLAEKGILPKNESYLNKCKTTLRKKEKEI